MTDNQTVSNALWRFSLSEAAGYSGPWMEAVKKLGEANPLDDKTQDLAYIAVLAAVRMESGIPFM